MLKQFSSAVLESFPSVPDADLLLLVCQVAAVAVVVVVRLDGVGGGAIEVLHATLWGQIGVVAGVLGHLQGRTYKVRQR